MNHVKSDLVGLVCQVYDCRMSNRWMHELCLSATKQHYPWHYCSTISYRCIIVQVVAKVVTTTSKSLSIHLFCSFLRSDIFVNTLDTSKTIIPQDSTSRWCYDDEMGNVIYCHPVIELPPNMGFVGTMKQSMEWSGFEQGTWWHQRGQSIHGGSDDT